MIRAFLIIGILMCSACATTELKKLEFEIKPILDKHASISSAMKGLKNVGFTCGEGTSIDLNKKNIYECSRKQGNIWPPFGCIHKVWLTKTKPIGEVYSYEIFKPVCTGV